VIHPNDAESFNTLLFLYFPMEIIGIKKGQEMRAFAHVHLCFQHCLCVQKENHCGTLFFMWWSFAASIEKGSNHLGI